MRRFGTTVVLGFLFAAGCATSAAPPPDDEAGDGGSTTGPGGSNSGGTGAGGSTGPVCGDGMVDAGEACDEGADNGGESCCDASCALRAADAVCRAGSGDVCDPDETCDGASAACPADVVADATTECRADTDAEGCDAAETCTGVAGEACPADAFELAGTPCGDGVAEPTCNPDVCDDLGTCTDASLLANGSSCRDNGGDTCCTGFCIAVGGDCCGLPTVPTLVVDIMESQSVMAGHTMDTQWLSVATSLGHTATIRAQTFLDSAANLSNTDILIVSSGVGPLPAARVTVITDYLIAGGAVFLQGEYQTTYDTNQAFAQIVGATGGTFTWNQTESGDLQPVTVQGCWATHPETVPSFDYHWYGASGSGSPEVILTYGAGTALGWSWCPPMASAGQIVHTTDQDFVINATTEDLTFMRNVIARLAFAGSCGS